MKNLYFDTYHTDMIGGGGLALYNLSIALQDLYEVHLAEPWNPNMEKYEFLREPSRPFKIGRPAKVDILLASKYSDFVAPTADVNVFYCLYPRFPWDMRGYQKILTLSQYSRKAIKVAWGVESEILIGGAFYPDYGPKEKHNNFLSSARFFMEGDIDQLKGHSKNQHLLIQAFRALPADFPWTLTLTGSVILESDRKYLEACRKLAQGDPRIVFIPMVTKGELRNLYAISKIHVHAMGYGRQDPAETEHYGICVEKGLISGCYSISHLSGGAPEFSHAVWSELEELPGVMQSMAQLSDHESIAQLNQWRTWDNFKREVRKAFSF